MFGRRSRNQEAPFEDTVAPPPPGQDDLLAWLEGLPVPALMVDARARVRWANAAARAWWPESSRLPTPLAALLGLEPEVVDTALWERGSEVRDWMLRPTGGQPVGCRCAISPLPDERRLLVMTPVEDLLQKARATGKLAERLEAAQSVGHIGVWERDLANGAGRWDAQMFGFWGLDTSGTPPSFEAATEAVIDADRDAFRQAYWDSITEPGRYSHRLRVRRPDGSIVRLHSEWVVKAGPQGQPEQVVGVMQDDTRTWEIGKAHDELHRQLSSAIDLAGIVLTTYDLKDQRVYMNPVGWQLLGLPQRPDGLSWDEGGELVHPEDQAALAASFEAARHSEEPLPFEIRLRRSDGQWRTLTGRRFGVRSAEGEVEALNDVGIDVTESRTAATAKSAALAAERELRAKSRFLARMSHELRTPLNAILGFARLLRAEPPQAPAGTRYERLAHIENAGRHLLALLDDILDLSKVEGGEMRIDRSPVHLQPQVTQVLALVEPQARQFNVTLEAGDLEVVALADATRLRQVLLNLVTNAIKYNRPGGRVHIAAETADEHVVLRVSDTGRGLTPEQLSRLFDPFDRLGAEGTQVEGTGIGLTIVKGLVERMGGTLKVDSTPEVGTTFEMRLWAADLSTTTLVLARPTLVEPSADYDRPGGTSGVVLYVEDNPVNTLIVEELVTRRPGMSMLSAEDGASGLASAAQHRPDLILLDLQLPDMDGREVFRRLKANPSTARIPCIALSGEAAQEEIQATLAAGFAGYLTKPVDFDAFDRALDLIFSGPTAQHIDLPADGTE